MATTTNSASIQRPVMGVVFLGCAAAEDLHLTGERHSYFSRNERGEILYTTHHFTADELAHLLEATGFERIDVTVEREASSRRPDEAAHFPYATCQSAHGQAARRP